MSDIQVQHTLRRNTFGTETDPGRSSLLVVGADTLKSGDIAIDGIVRVEGCVHGVIQAKRIVVTDSATVEGALFARSIHVDGTVIGPLSGNRVSLGPTARIRGDIAYEAMTMATGASVSGLCRDRGCLDTGHSTAALDTDTGTGTVMVLPFSLAKAAYRRSPASLRRPAPGKPTPIRMQSMRSVWDAYLKDRDCKASLR